MYFNRIKSYLRYFIKTRFKTDNPSPFVAELIESIFSNNCNYYAFKEIEKRRTALLNNHQSIEVNDFGAGSKTMRTSKRKISAITKTTATPEKYGKLLFRMVNHFQPKLMLEIGTGTGLSTLYMASAKKQAEVISLEGSAELAQIAREQITKLSLSNTTILTGKFEETLHNILEKRNNLDFVFIDGNHRKNSTIKYFNLCVGKLSKNGIIVLDDIHWSSEMTAAWQHIIKHTEVKVSIDLYRLGIIFIKNDLTPQHFTLSY